MLAPPAVARDYTLGDALSALPQAAAWRALDRNVDAAQASLNAASGNAINLSVGGDGARVASSSATPELNAVQLNASVNATATFAVAPWSPVYDGVRAAALALERARLERRTARATLWADTVERYFAARNAGFVTLLAERAVALQTQRLRIAEGQARVGTGTQEGVRVAQAALETARANSNAASGNERLARRALFVTIGQADQADARLNTAPEERVVPALESVDVHAALERREDVGRALLTVREAEDALAIARRDRLLPQANLVVSVGGANGNGQPTGAQANVNFNVQSGTLGVSTAYGFGTPAATQFTLSVSVSLPVVSPGADGRIRAAEAGLQAAQLALEQARATAEVEVLGAWTRADAAAQQVRVANANLAAARQRLADTERRVELELSPALELDAARLSSDQAERDLESAVAAASVAAWRLEIALGNDISGTNGATR
jgi:outer membrane protein TolC